MDEFGGNLFFYPNPMDIIYHLFIKRMVRVAVVASTCGFGYFCYKFVKHEFRERDEGMVDSNKRTIIPMPLFSSKETDMYTIHQTIKTLVILRFTIFIVHEYVDCDPRKLLLLVDVWTMLLLYEQWPPFRNGIKEYKDRSYCDVPASGSPVNGLCIVATNLDTLNTITREVQQVINQSYPIESRLVTNRRDIADLPTYRHAVCCVSNAPRIISFNDHGELEPDADLVFRAFDKMERSADPYGVIVIVFNHEQSKGSSKLHSMEGTPLPPRLQDLVDKSCLLTVYRHFNEKQQKRIVECIKP